MFDRIIDFLFRTRLGNLVLVIIILASSSMFGGCLLFDLPSCFCESFGCEDIADCWGACDDACNSCFTDSCGGCGPIDCLFDPDGCTNDCGDCGVLHCGGCNRSIFTDCGAGCSGGCGDCTMECGNCTFSCDDDYNPDYDDDGCGGCGGSHKEEPRRSIPMIILDQNGNVIYETSFSYKEKEDVTSISLSYVSDLFNPTYYEFVGYYEDEACTKSLTDSQGNWNSKTKIKNVNKIYGKVTELYYGEARVFNFEFEGLDEAVALAPSTVYVGQPVSGFPAAPDVPGYNFLGWYLNGELFEGYEDGEVFHLSSVGTKDAFITLVGKYAPVTYTVMFVTETDVYPISNLKYGTKFETLFAQLPSSLLNDEVGKVTGWVRIDENNGMIPMSGNDIVTGDIFVHAVYQRYVTMTLHGYYGPEDARSYTVNELEDEWFTMPWPQSNERDIFEGWYYDEACTRPAAVTQGSSVLVDSDECVFYAKWRQVNEFRIFYYYSKGDPNYLQTQDYTYSDTQSIPLTYRAASEFGYEFEGWCLDPDLKDTPLTSLPAGTSGTIRLYAKFKPKNFNITLHAVDGTLNGGSTYITQSVPYGGNFTLPIPAKQNHDFDGWFFNGTTRVTDGAGNLVINFTREGLGVSDFDNITLTARYKLKQFTLTFVVDNGGSLTTYATITCEYGTAPGALPPQLSIEPTRTGYTFEGWFTDSGVQFIAAAPVTENRTYKARFKVNTYKIYLNADGGTLTGSAEVDIEFGTQIRLAVPQRDGYIFLGWMDESTNRYITGLDGYMLSPYNVDGNLHLKAMWQQI